MYDHFFENHDEDMLRGPYKDYSSLNRWQANRVLLSTLPFANYFSVTTLLRQGKKASILPPGDVNPRPVSSR
jgi:hypothetical protein